MAKIIIKIPYRPTEPVSVAVEGVLGSSCSQLTAGVEAALGRVIEDEKSPEYFVEQQTDQQIEQGNQ